MTTEKKKILVISDHPLAPSGVGTQTRYVLTALLETGRYKVVCFGGAMKHKNYSPQQVDGYGEDFVIYPVDGYGNTEMLRSALFTEKPDMVWFMTDPRFYGWLWDMENEIRPHCPMVYYHVWDNYPYPHYNKEFYDSTDVIASISKVTHDIVNTVAPEVENHYVPHAVDTNIFSPLSTVQVEDLKSQMFGEGDQKITFFWNNRNARRKQSGSLLFWFNEFAEEVGPENVRLLLHTDPNDPHGPNLESIIKYLNADDGRFLISKDKVPPEKLSLLYNVSDCTVNISDAEGFGLSTLESLSCGTPIIVTMTGGLQEQVTDGENTFGIGIEPSTKSVIGSQTVPFIYEDRISKEDFVNALKDIYSMTKDQRRLLGIQGRQHVIKNYNFNKFNKSWVNLVDSIVESRGSWESRKKYKSWDLREIK
tara:strand:+ start:3211 stop:4473 length:1263 start_codon:yes stop_codon:yes gene_type:complete